jgi:hypothetical protein
MGRIQEMPISIENYSSFHVERHVRKAIEIVGKVRFEGISAIRLLDFVDSGREPTCIPPELAEPRSSGLSLSGCYFESDSEGRLIELYLGEILRGIPSPLRLTPIPLIRLVQTLAHAVCQHHVSIRKTEYDEQLKENFANRYARLVTRRLKREYPYKLWAYILKELASWHFAFALADFRQKDLLRAENGFYTAWLLDNENALAAENYWTVRNQRLG